VAIVSDMGISIQMTAKFTRHERAGYSCAVGGDSQWNPAVPVEALD